MNCQLICLILLGFCLSHTLGNHPVNPEASCVDGTDPRCDCDATSDVFLMHPYDCNLYVQCIAASGNDLASSKILRCPADKYFVNSCVPLEEASECCERPGAICY